MIVVQTPLRISFLGGGTDFEDFYKEHGGAVLSTTIDKSVFVVVKERFDDKIYINTMKKEIVGRVEDVEHELVRHAMEVTGVDKGVEITTLSDIPSDGGSGLGSSSSITVALLHALHTYKGELVTKDQLAEEACEVEIERCRSPIGKQDQYIAAFGGLKFIEFGTLAIGVEEVEIGKEGLWELERHLMMFYIGGLRSSGSILRKQKRGIECKAESLKNMVALTQMGKEVLEEGNLGAFGLLLSENWEEKRNLVEGISRPDIDRIYNKVVEWGVLGGKICGAGGGGFLMLLCPPDKQEDVRRIVGLEELRFKFEPLGSRVVLDYRR